jgi:hypothetical protein
MKEVNMNDGDWMRHIDFEALDEHVEETISFTPKQQEEPYCECQNVYVDCGWQHFCR